MATVKKEDRPDDSRQIIPKAEDPEMFAWLESLFDIAPTEPPAIDTATGAREKVKPKSEPDSFPGRVALFPVFGSGGRDTGKQVDEKIWKPMSSAVPSREELVELANVFLGKAQRECNALKHAQKYALFAYSNLKGASPYTRYLFNLSPTGKEYKEGQTPGASDDEDTHRDRFLSTALAHQRWNQEQTNEVTGGVMKLQQEIIREQRDWIRQMEADRRQWIITTEEALDRKEERAARAERAKITNTAILEGIGVVKSLMPPVIAYLTKGKSGLLEGVKQFVDGLNEQQANELLGMISSDGGSIASPGILTEQQVFLIRDIIKGVADPKRIADLIPGRTSLSLEMEQIQRASQILSEAQLGGLMALVDAAKKAMESEERK